MKIEKVKISEVFSNENNPRTITDSKLEKLTDSIREFPEMLEIRPIVVNNDNVVLGGNMRLEACKGAGLEHVYIVKASNLTEEQQKEFIIKDNVGFGSWDWDMLANEWDTNELGKWGLEVWQTENEEIDYSILEDEDLSSELSGMESGVKKAIQIEFELEHYEEAQKLVKFWRDKDVYIGAMIIEKLKEQKDNEES